MIIEKINKLYHLDDEVIRNTPALSSEVDTLSDLADDAFDLEVVHKTVEQNKLRQLNKFEYHAVDYVFNRKKSFQSRFSNGSYPVWYGSRDQETSHFETVFHWHNSVLDDINYNEEMPVITYRSLFSVDCSATLVDLRSAIKNIPELIDKNINVYKTTQELSNDIYQQGQPGLYTYSARKEKGENVVIFTRNSLKNVSHLFDVKYFYDFKKQVIRIIDKSSEKEILSY